MLDAYSTMLDAYSTAHLEEQKVSRWDVSRPQGSSLQTQLFMNGE